jgi:hypothetical protein
MIEYILIGFVIGIITGFFVWYRNRCICQDAESDSDTCLFYSDDEYDDFHDFDSKLSNTTVDVWTDSHNYQRHRSGLRRSNRLTGQYETNYPYVLIIIDMQDQFATSRNNV